MPERTEKWDTRFLQVARLISTFSKDPSTQTGAVIVRNNQIVGTGFNGFPQCMPDEPELYANREEKYSRIVHCEVNAVLLANSSVRGCTLYTWPFASCDRCVVIMLQAGIERFVFPEPSVDALARWASAFDKTKNYIAQCNKRWTEYPRTGELA